VSIDLARDSDDPANRGGAGRWPAKLTIRDRYERPVFYGVGLVSCET
jgi:hypothetical protein